MSTTTGVACPAGEWTEVASGSAQVTIQATIGSTATPGGFYIGVGSTPPASIADAPQVSAADNFAELSGLANTDNVYVYPVVGPLFARVIAA